MLTESFQGTGAFGAKLKVSSTAQSFRIILNCQGIAQWGTWTSQMYMGEQIL